MKSSVCLLIFSFLILCTACRTQTLPRAHSLARAQSWCPLLLCFTNVIIDIHPSQASRLWPVARALAEALAAEGIAAAYDQGSGGGNTNERAIHVLVGRKL